MADDKDKLQDALSQFGKYTEVIASMIKTNFDPQKIYQQIQDYESQAVGVNKVFGVGRDRIVELKASMADAVVSVTQMGGNLQNVAAIATVIGSTLNRNMILTGKSYKDLYAAAEVTGIRYETLIPKFKEAGFSVYQISENMKKVVDIATASGVNAKAVSSTVVSNMGMMDKFNFVGGVEGLAKMVTQATNLNISVDQIGRVMNAAFSPDKAIEMAAGLQRLGVQQSALLDPLRLMDMARNDPAELQNQIVEMSKSFVEFNEKTKSFQIAPGAKGQLIEVANALGMNEDQLAKMAKASAELEDKMKKIKFPGDAFTEEQRTMIANMAEMGEGGEYMLRIKGEDLKIDEAMVKIQSMSEDERKKFLADSKPKSMEEMAKQQLTASERTAAAVESLANRRGAAYASSDQQEMAFGANVEVADSLTKLMSGESWSVKGIRESQNVVTKDTLEGFKSGDLLGTASKIYNETKKFTDNMFDDLVVGSTKAMEGIKNSSNPLIETIVSLSTKMGSVVSEHEKLNTSLNTLNTTVGNTTTALGGTATKEGTITAKVTAQTNATTEASKEIKNLEPKTNIQTNNTEIKFKEPLKLDITISGLLPGMSEEQIKQLFIEGKLNEAVYNALKEAEKTKI
jgi:hypothetical protein